jgi:hypothetical protein
VKRQQVSFRKKAQRREIVKQVSHVIKTRRTDVSQIVADREEFQRIVEDMRINGGMLIPTAAWLAVDPHVPVTSDTAPYLDEVSSDAAFEARFATMGKMLEGWIGSGQIVEISPSIRHAYRRFVERCDPLGLWDANLGNEEVGRRLIAADLGTIMDLDLIFAFAPSHSGRSMIVEVGGGYGRLAEAALNIFGHSIFYVLVDSVPGSLYYAKRYLQTACPDKSVGSYYDGEDFDLNRFDCFVLPSWRFEELNVHSYNVCVNIESFQEMSQNHVDYYLQMFDRVAGDGAVMYISNSHDYLFKGRWNYPQHWRKAFCAKTPRSWTRNHPTEIFVKSASDVSAANAAVDAGYLYANEPDVENYLATIGGRAALVPVARYFGRQAVQRVRQTVRRGK